ncbi:MAG: site-specific DNA-methyltransferase, partial [Fibrobacter sp.]|nr:site-specific DNA-methyltransferase [Fibrobacter sp.]
METLKMQTPNRTQNNIERIAQLFPNVITESHDENGKIKKVVDFDLLRQQLSEVLVEDDNERYRLDWPGKKASLLKANMPIKKTLRPCREESVNFDTTENLYIEGDNFEVLKILQESYLGKIKMIYIDPPYNTGNDFIYKDDFKKSKEEYEEELGVEDEDGGKLFRNTDSNGRFHSDWLSMMYERLLVARDLLRDDGVIFISIDDNEVHNLRKICDEIFGEENFIVNFVWEKRTNRENRKEVSYRHDNTLCIAKSRSTGKVIKQLPMNAKALANYKNFDNDPRGLWKSDPATAQSGHGTNSQFYDLVAPNGRIHKLESGRCWLYTKPVMEEAIRDNRIWFGKDGNGVPRVKTFLEGKDRGLTPETIIFAEQATTNEFAKNQLKELFNGFAVFETPKPIDLIKVLLLISCDEGIVLDFFAGSAATAHATMQLNAEDGGNRKFIMVQLPEQTDEASEAYKAGFKTIADIGKERIRRAGKKILEELTTKNTKGTKKEEDKIQNDLFNDSENNIGSLSSGSCVSWQKNLDIGFRVYKTDTTNMKDVFYHPTELQQTTLD